MNFSLSGITLQQMMVFIQVVESGGFAKASNYLHITQSAISKSIAKLEKELNMQLFERTTREIHLTKMGEILYLEWKDALKQLDQGYKKAQIFQENQDNTLRIGILNSARPELYFWSLEETMKQKFPNITLEMGCKESCMYFNE